MKQYEITITLKDLPHPCFRKIIVDSDISLSELHDIIQLCMGWSNSHLYEFITADNMHLVDRLDPDSNNEVLASDVLLEDLSSQSNQLKYIYDFGDWWEHTLIISETQKHHDKIAILIEAEGYCPPEDVGGVPGYEMLLETLNYGSLQDKEDYLEWLEAIEYNAEDTVDIVKINKDINRLIQNPSSNKKHYN